MSNLEYYSSNVHAVACYISDKTYVAAGWIWNQHDNSFFDGWVEFENGRVISVGKTRPPPSTPNFRGIVIPGLVNYHTHLGDGIFAKHIRPLIKEKTISDIVEPPHGLKHKLLAETNSSDIVRGIVHMFSMMISNGTTGYIDFREDGISGLLQMSEALESHLSQSNNPSNLNRTFGEVLSSVILGRPSSIRFNEEEVRQLLKNCDGIGLSAYSDWEPNPFRSIVRAVHNQHKLFATHVSEVNHEPFDEILDIAPNLLVHMIHSTKKEWQILAEMHLPVVCCPRANDLFASQPPIVDMYNAGVHVLLGTDNAMFVDPDILEEVRYAYHNIPSFHKEGKRGFCHVLRMVMPDAIIPAFAPVPLEEDSLTRFIILKPHGLYRTTPAEELLATTRTYENVRVSEKYIIKIKT